MPRAYKGVSARRCFRDSPIVSAVSVPEQQTTLYFLTSLPALLADDRAPAPTHGGWRILSTPSADEMVADTMHTFIATHATHSSITVDQGILIHPRLDAFESMDAVDAFLHAYRPHILAIQTELRRGLPPSSARPRS
jgi:hypothetical protein